MSLPRRRLSLLLALTPGIGGKSVARILQRNDLMGRSPEEFLRFAPEVYREEYKITAKAARALAERRQSLADIEAMEKRLDALGVSLVTADDVHYPRKLEAMDPDPPGVLFLYGNQKLLSAKTFCVLSSRNTPPSGLETIERLAEEGVLRGEVLVSGHDRPEYQRSAVVPLRWGAPRILVLDRGLFDALGENLREEPFRAARLWRYQFDPGTDLVVSPFRPESRFIGVNNQVRDRLVAGLSDRLDFVHVAEGGMMEKLADRARRSGRQVVRQEPG